jgi:hypothetical protein
MLKFNQYINENAAYYAPKPIEVDTRRLMNIVDALNAELDVLTAKPYQNAPIFLNQLRGCLDKSGMMLPAEATPHFLNLGAELVYSMGDSGLHLYIVYDTTDDGYVDGYAQIVNPEDLKDLLGMDPSDYLGHEEIKQRPSTWYAKRDDDSGNTNEY